MATSKETAPESRGRRAGKSGTIDQPDSRTFDNPAPQKFTLLEVFLDVPDKIAELAEMIVAVYMLLAIGLVVTTVVFSYGTPPQVYEQAAMRHRDLQAQVTAQQAYIDVFKFKMRTAPSDTSFTQDLATLQDLIASRNPAWTPHSRKADSAHAAGATADHRSATAAPDATATGAEHSEDVHGPALRSAVRDAGYAGREERQGDQHLKGWQAAEHHHAPASTSKLAAGKAADNGPGRNAGPLGKGGLARKLAQYTPGSPLTGGAPISVPAAAMLRAGAAPSPMHVVTTAAAALQGDPEQADAERFMAALRKCHARIRVEDGSGPTTAMLNRSRGALSPPAAGSSPDWRDAATLHPTHLYLLTHIHLRDRVPGKRLWTSETEACSYSDVFADLPLAENLRSLELADVQLFDYDSGILASSLAGGCCKQLQILRMTGHPVTDAGAKKLAAGLGGLQHLRTLELSGNYLSTQAVQALADAITMLPELKDVNVRSILMGIGKRQFFTSTLSVKQHKAAAADDLGVW